MRIGVLPAERIKVLEKLRHALGDAVEVCALIEQPVHPALGRGGVMT
jgi:hypothetical protein